LPAAARCCRRARVAGFITRHLDRESVSVFGGGVVAFLSLAQPTAVDIFPFYLCPDFTRYLVPGLSRSFSARVFFG